MCHFTDCNDSSHRKIIINSLLQIISTFSRFYLLTSRILSSDSPIYQSYSSVEKVFSNSLSIITYKITLTVFSYLSKDQRQCSKVMISPASSLLSLDDEILESDQDIVEFDCKIIEISTDQTNIENSLQGFSLNQQSSNTD